MRAARPRALRTATISILLTLGVAPGARADLVQNGDFASGLGGWVQPGAPPATYAIVASTRNGTNAAQVTGRGMRDAAPRQNLAALLAGGGSGRTYSTRFWATTSAPASVRAFLTINDAAGSRRVILAERVLRNPGAWEQAEATATLTFTSPLQSAILSFEGEKVAEGIYPDLTIDDVSVELDADADQLTDPEEQGLGTDPSSRDTDGDGLPDGWEQRSGQDPRAPDAASDRDADGFSAWQEYMAATDPGQASQYPGRTVGPSAQAQGVLRYLALLPSTGACAIVGQHLSYPAPPLDEYTSFVTGLAAATGKLPGVLGLQYDDGGNPLQVAAVNPYAIQWWGQGGLVQIKWNPRNPWTGNSYGDRTFNGFGEVITTGTAANASYMAWLAEVADGLLELKQAGVVVLWRVCSEMNGGWFWWGRRDRQGYVDFWRHMHDYLVNQRGLDNLLWVYEPDSSVHDACMIDYYYPGDNVVDVMGHNLYSDTWVLPFDAELLGRSYGKVYAVPQAGPGPQRDGTWSNLTFLDGAPPGSGGIRNRHPRLSFFLAWNSFWGWDPVLQQSVYRSMAIVDNRQAAELMNEPCVVTRDEIVLCTLPPRVPLLLLAKATAGTTVAFRWTDVAGANDYLALEDSLPAGAFATTAGSAPSGNPGLSVPDPQGTRFYRVAGRSLCGTGPSN